MQYFALATLAAGAMAAPEKSIERDVARYAAWQNHDSSYCSGLKNAAKRADPRCQYEGEFMSAKEKRDLATANNLFDRLCKQGTFLRTWNRGEALWYNLGNYWTRGEELDYNDSAQVTRSASSPGAGWYKMADANSSTEPGAPRETMLVKRFKHISDVIQMAERRSIKFDDVDYPVQSLVDMLNCEAPQDDGPPPPPPVVTVAQSQSCGQSGVGACFTVDTSTNTSWSDSSDLYFVWFSTDAGNSGRVQLRGQAWGHKGYRVCSCHQNMSNTEIIDYVKIQQQTGADGWEMDHFTADVNPGDITLGASPRATRWTLAAGAPYHGVPGKPFWVDGDDCSSYSAYGCCPNQEACEFEMM